MGTEEGRCRAVELSVELSFCWDCRVSVKRSSGCWLLGGDDVNFVDRWCRLCVVLFEYVEENRCCRLVW